MSFPFQAGIAILTVLLSFALYQVKYSVRDARDELVQLKAEVAREHEAIRVLEAEWSYLNDPGRLQGLVRRHGSLELLRASQIKTLDALQLITPLSVSQKEKL